tara:strand:+ start:80 stop:550 length:471 start_codon:yes stop_codon:yes gene_type:complete
MKIKNNVGLSDSLADRTRTDYIVIHHSATRAHQDFDVFDIIDWHKERSWDTVGYHFIIKRNGVIQNGRPINKKGAHVYGFNSKSIGICVMGGSTDDMKGAEDNFTDEQYEALRTTVLLCSELYPDAKIVKHRDLDDKKEEDNRMDLERIRLPIRKK